MDILYKIRINEYIFYQIRFNTFGFNFPKFFTFYQIGFKIIYIYIYSFIILNNYMK
jgi:hypothetical protein